MTTNLNPSAAVASPGFLSPPSSTLAVQQASVSPAGSNPGLAAQPRTHHSSLSVGSASSSSTVVGAHYKIGKKIGEGSFGIIYEGVSLLNETPVAIKFESRKSDAPQLRDEYRTYKLLAGSVGVPNVYYFGQEGLHNILVIDLLGSSLEDLFDICNRKFNTKTVAMVAKQMISRVQTVHEKGLIYRDIKPDNFLVGRGPAKQNMVYMVDFGMAKQYRDPKTKQHIPYRERKSLSGTARYMSINTHLGREQSRRDDLEALGHVFLYFLRGSLPWQGLKAATNKQKYERIGEKKQQTSIRELCDGHPEEFVQYLTYSRKLGFEETPDYDYLRSLMNKVLMSYDEGDDGVYDWMLVDKEKLRKPVKPEHSNANFRDSNAIAVSAQDVSKNDVRGDVKQPFVSNGRIQGNHQPTSPLAGQTRRDDQRQQQSQNNSNGGMGNEARRVDRRQGGVKGWFLKTFCCH